MIYALYRRWKQENKKLDYRMGVIAAEIRNTLRDRKNRRVWQASDFMAPEPVKQMTVKESIDYVAHLNRLFGGQDLRQAVG